MKTRLLNITALICLLASPPAYSAGLCREVFAPPSKFRVAKSGSFYGKVTRIASDGSIQLAEGAETFASIRFKDGLPIMRKMVVHLHDEPSLSAQALSDSKDLIQRGKTLTWFTKDARGKSVLYIYSEFTRPIELPHHVVRALSDDGRFVVSTDGKSIHLLDTLNKTETIQKIGILKSLSLAVKATKVIGVQVTNEGQVLSWLDDGTLRTHNEDLSVAKVEKTKSLADLGKLHWIESSPNQTQVLIASASGVSLYDLLTKQIRTLSQAAKHERIHWLEDYAVIETNEQNFFFARDLSNAHFTNHVEAEEIGLNHISSTFEQNNILVRDLENLSEKRINLPESLMLAHPLGVKVSPDGNIASITTTEKGSDGKNHFNLIFLDFKTNSIIAEEKTTFIDSEPKVIFGPTSDIVIASGDFSDKLSGTFVFKLKRF